MRDELGRAAAKKTPTRWLDAALAMANGSFEHAAATYAEIGSVPDELLARRYADSPEPG
jgi:hypothetical protein